MECQKLETKGGSFNFKFLILFKSDIHLHCFLQMLVLIDKIRDIYSYEDVIVLIVF